MRSLRPPRRAVTKIGEGRWSESTCLRPARSDRNAASCRRLSLLLWQVRPSRSTATSKTPLDRSIAIVVGFSMDTSFSVSLRRDDVGTQMLLHVMKEESTSSLQRPSPRALAWLGPCGRVREFQGWPYAQKHNASNSILN